MRVFLKILECSFKQEEGVKCNKPKTFVGILNGKEGGRERVVLASVIFEKK
jgi:hypothetical protein